MSEDTASTSSVSKKKLALGNKCKASCCVPCCTKIGYVLEGTEKVTFHTLPLSNPHLIKRWYVAIRRDPGPLFKPSKHTKICSRHFKKDDFWITRGGRRFLKDTTVPSIFHWSKLKTPRRVILQQHQSRRAAESVIASDEPLSPADDTACSTEDQHQQEMAALHTEIDRLKQELQLQKEAASLFQKERDYLKQLLSAERKKQSNFSMEKIKHSDKLVSFYTGFPSYKELEACFNVIDPGKNGENILYIDGHTSDDKRRPSSKPRKLDVKDEFLMCLVRLRLGLFSEDLAFRFNVSKSTVSRLWLSWLNFMYLRLGQLDIWPTQDSIRKTMPHSMKEKYPSLEWIIDAFKLQTQRPSSLVLQSQAYSNYKSRTTLKGLLACTPSGQIGFVSQLYTGSISDRELTIRSGFLRMKHNRGAMWLVDKGFQIQDLAEPLGVHVNMPAYVGNRTQMTADEVFHTQQVASERIHIERAINKVKNFHIFDAAIPLSMYGTINQIWTICALLTLFQSPIISA